MASSTPTSRSTSPSTSRTRLRESHQEAPYLTHVVRHHGQLTLIPPENSGRVRKEKKKKKPKVLRSNVTVSERGSPSGSMRTAGSGSVSPASFPGEIRRASYRTPLGDGIVYNSNEYFDIPDFPPPEYEEAVISTSRPSESQELHSSSGVSSSATVFDVTDVVPRSPLPGHSVTVSPRSPTRLERSSYDEPNGDPAVLPPEAIERSPWEEDRRLGLNLEDRVRREFERRQAFHHPQQVVTGISEGACSLDRASLSPVDAGPRMNSVLSPTTRVPSSLSPCSSPPLSRRSSTDNIEPGQHSPSFADAEAVPSRIHLVPPSPPETTSSLRTKDKGKGKALPETPQDDSGRLWGSNSSPDSFLHENTYALYNSHHMPSRNPSLHSSLFQGGTSTSICVPSISGFQDCTTGHLCHEESTQPSTLHSIYNGNNTSHGDSLSSTLFPGDEGPASPSHRSSSSIANLATASSAPIVIPDNLSFLSIDNDPQALYAPSVTPEEHLSSPHTTSRTQRLDRPVVMESGYDMVSFISSGSSKLQTPGSSRAITPPPPAVRKTRPPPPPPRRPVVKRPPPPIPPRIPYQSTSSLTESFSSTVEQDSHAGVRKIIRRKPPPVPSPSPFHRFAEGSRSAPDLPPNKPDTSNVSARAVLGPEHEEVSETTADQGHGDDVYEEPNNAASLGLISDDNFPEESERYERTYDNASLNGTSSSAASLASSSPASSVNITYPDSALRGQLHSNYPNLTSAARVSPIYSNPRSPVVSDRFSSTEILLAAQLSPLDTHGDNSIETEQGRLVSYDSDSSRPFEADVSSPSMSPWPRNFLHLNDVQGTHRGAVIISQEDSSQSNERTTAFVPESAPDNSNSSTGSDRENQNIGPEQPVVPSPTLTEAVSLAESTDLLQPPVDTAAPMRPTFGDYTDLDLLLLRLESGNEGDEGLSYDDLLSLSEIIGPANNAPGPSRAMWEDLPLGKVEVERRRVTKEGKTKLKLSLLGLGVDKCSICLSQFKGDEMAFLLSCQHAFHEQCLRSWLCRNATCPLCRSTIAAGA